MRENRVERRPYDFRSGYVSYAEVVKEGGREANEGNCYTKRVDEVKEDLGSGIKWNACNNDLSWAKFCVVGVLYSIKPISNVCARLIIRGISFEVNYLRGLKLLWSFQSEDDRKEFCHNRFLWDDVIDYCEDHGNWIVTATKVRWIELKGRMDLCHILVATSEGSSCPDIVPVEVGKECFRVKVHEVCDVPSDEWLWEQLGLRQIYFSVASEMANSPVKSPNGKLV
ncbi:hypothetical protein Q3G72_028558 [Acer saccharum]|nr:hypothetical protein Q3G72_028558 [Acer saccharum]